MAYIGNPPAPQNITSSEITDGTIVNVDIASDAAIAATKIAGLSTVATTGAYSDVTGTPTIPVAGTDFVAQTGGTFTGNVDFADGVAARFGQSQDLSISHDGSNSYINELGDGDLVIQTNGNKIGLASSSPFEWMVEAVPNGAVTLSYDGSAKLETTAYGTLFTGNSKWPDNGKATFGASDDLQIYHNGTQSYIEDAGTGELNFKTNGVAVNVINSAGRNLAQFNNGGGYARLYFDDGSTSAVKLQTGSGGITVTGAVVSDSGNISGELIADSYNETYAALSGTSPAVNCHNGNSFSLTLSGNTTFTFSNPPASGTSYTFSIEIIQDSGASGYTVGWPVGIISWPAATAPTLTATASAKDIFVFTTRDGGTNWYGFTAGQALA